MPTASNESVFIKWTRLEVQPNLETGNFNCTAQMIVNVAGTLVATFNTYVATDEDAILDELSNVLEDKRQEYVTP